MSNNLPTPSAFAKAQSDLLRQQIIDEIQQNGPMSFYRYMQLALYAPELGYYRSSAIKLGEHGDFITAPLLSPLFSQCLAKQCQQVLQQCDRPCILELGAGTGVMAKDILLTLNKANVEYHKYFILEVSAELKQRQRDTIANEAPELLQRVEWIERLPTEFTGVILANEVLDAMPVHKFFIDETIKEFYVDVIDDQLQWKIDSPSEARLIEKVKQLNIDFANHYESEINLSIEAFIKSLADALQQGVIVFIDYGFPAHEYYHHDRSMGTIMCHYQHRAHSDPLILPGLQDITAHVDFTAIANAAVDNQLTLSGFTNQAAFLINCGLMDLAARDTIKEQFTVNQQIKRLTMPSEMGELFKVMALSKNFTEPLLGFTMMNQMARL